MGLKGMGSPRFVNRDQKYIFIHIISTSMSLFIYIYMYIYIYVYIYVHMYICTLHFPEFLVRGVTQH